MPELPRLTTTVESPELLALRQEVRDFIDRKVAQGDFVPAVNSWLVGWDTDFSRELAERGWLGMTIPVEYGGRGATFLERFVVMEELLAAGAPVAAHWISDRQIGPSLLKFGTEEQKRRLLPGVAAGTVFFGIGMSEPDSGSDLASVRTTATKVDGGWRVNGSKIWTSGAHAAHYFIALVRSEPLDTAHRHAGLSQLIIALDADGVDIRPIVSMDGDHHFNEIFLDDVFVPDEMLLGTAGQGWEQVTSELGYERSGPERFLSTLPLLEALGRDQDLGGVSSATYGAFAARILGLHEMSLSIADGLATGRPVDDVAAMVKVLGTTTEGDIAEAAGLASTAPVGTELYGQVAAALLDRPGFSLRGGTNEILRGVIAREMGLR
jgi:hypothetical protein